MHRTRDSSRAEDENEEQKIVAMMMVTRPPGGAPFCEDDEYLASLIAPHVARTLGRCKKNLAVNQSAGQMRHLHHLGDLNFRDADDVVSAATSQRHAVHTRCTRGTHAVHTRYTRGTHAVHMLHTLRTLRTLHTLHTLRASRTSHALHTFRASRDAFDAPHTRQVNAVKSLFAADEFNMYVLQTHDPHTQQRKRDSNIERNGLVPIKRGISASPDSVQGMDVLCGSTQSVRLIQSGKPLFYPPTNRLPPELKPFADIVASRGNFERAITHCKRPQQAAFKSMLCVPVNVHKEVLQLYHSPPHGTTVQPPCNRYVTVMEQVIRSHTHRPPPHATAV